MIRDNSESESLTQDSKEPGGPETFSKMSREWLQACKLDPQKFVTAKMSSHQFWKKKEKKDKTQIYGFGLGLLRKTTIDFLFRSCHEF